MRKFMAFLAFLFSVILLSPISSAWAAEYLYIGQPEDIANSILFLASSMSDYITGACVCANGGRNMD